MQTRFEVHPFSIIMSWKLNDNECHSFRNELERQFLEMLQFNINVPSSVYAKYYFDLRTLAEANELSFPPEPLSKERAQKLEAMSVLYEDKVGHIIHGCTLYRLVDLAKDSLWLTLQ